MAIRRRKWQTGEAWVVDLYDPSTKSRLRKSFSRKADAEAFRVATESRIKAGTFRPDGARMLVTELVEAYLQHIAARRERGDGITPAYEATIRSLAKNYFSKIGHWRLAETSSGRLAAWRDELRASGCSTGHVRRVLGALASVFAFAQERDLIAANPARGLRVVANTEHERRIVEPVPKHVFRKLIEAAPLHLSIKIATAGLTGLRQSELSALRWQDVDFERGVITVTRRVDRFGNFGVTKSAAGRREVPISKSLVADLRRWRLASRFSTDADLGFPNAAGKPVNHSAFVRRYWQPLFKQIGEPYLGFHSLRHLAVSLMLESGLSLKEVSTIIGHSTLALTSDRYGHLVGGDEGRAAAMDRIHASLFA